MSNEGIEIPDDHHIFLGLCNYKENPDDEECGLEATTVVTANGVEERLCPTHWARTRGIHLHNA